MKKLIITMALIVAMCMPTSVFAKSRYTTDEKCQIRVMVFCGDSVNDGSIEEFEEYATEFFGGFKVVKKHTTPGGSVVVIFAFDEFYGTGEGDMGSEEEEEEE